MAYGTDMAPPILTRKAIVFSPSGSDGHGGVRHSVAAIQQLQSIARDGIATLRRSFRGVRGQIRNHFSRHTTPPHYGDAGAASLRQAANLFTPPEPI
jgi:hypothetical protein